MPANWDGEKRSDGPNSLIHQEIAMNRLKTRKLYRIRMSQREIVVKKVLKVL